jgi:alpha-beta hydrolase superfamily lysophospholipase
MREGVICRWLKQEGEPVDAGEPILEVETEKMTNLVESPSAGVLARILFPAGATVPVTRTIALITGPGEAVADLPPPDAAPPPPAPIQTAQPGAAATPSPSVRAMPAARRLAAEHGLDLSRLVGSGPQGAITREDVEHAVRLGAARPAAPVQKVGFYSDGVRVEGILYTPERLQPGQKCSAVVLLGGYTYTKAFLLPEIARVLNAAGYVALAFDYRGFGDSQGSRWRLMPADQVADARAALTFLSEQSQVEPDRLALVGVSLGGSIAIAAAAADPRVRVVAAIASPGNGERWLRGLRRYSEWRAFQAQLAADRSRRVRSGESSRVHPLEIVLPDPDSRSIFERIYAEFPDMRCDVSLETADALIEFRPEDDIAGLAPRPVLLVHGANDLLVPPDESRQLFERAASPRRLEIVPDVGHFDWVLPTTPGFKAVMEPLRRFLQDALPAT